jgi:hypothetical protein
MPPTERRPLRVKPAIEAYKQSFEGLYSTLIDNSKRFLGLATLPLFERIKTTLGEANRWFDDHQETVSRWAGVIGDRLGSAFDLAKDKIRSWWPDIEAFAEHAYDRTARAFFAIASTSFGEGSWYSR